MDYEIPRSGIMEVNMKNEKLLKLVLTGVFAALSYVVFTFLQIKLTLPGGDATSIHLGNAICVLGALLLGGLYGGLGGALGMTAGDLFDPVYVVYAPKTFIALYRTDHRHYCPSYGTHQHRTRQR